MDDELAAMKAQLLNSTASQQEQFSSRSISTTPNDAAVDIELEALKFQLDQL